MNFTLCRDHCAILVTVKPPAPLLHAKLGGIFYSFNMQLPKMLVATVVDCPCIRGSKRGMLRPSSFPSYSQSCSLANILIPLEQIPRVDLFRHVGQVVAPAVDHDHVAAILEGRQVVRHHAAEELRRVERGLAGHHGDALGLDALHDALDGACAEVVGVRLHGQAVHAHHGLLLALVHQRHHAVDHLLGHEVLAGAVGLHDGLDEVLRHVLVVGQQLLGVLGKAYPKFSKSSDA